MTNYLYFALAVLAVLATPGPTNTLLATSGATVGLYRSAPLLLAEICGYLIPILVIGGPLRSLISGSLLATLALRLVAAIYLFTRAVNLWKVRIGPQPKVVAFRHVFVTTLFNPKALIFALVIIPMEAPDAGLYLLAFSLTLPLVGSAWIAFGAAATRATGNGYLPLIPKLASVALAAFGTLLIVSTFVR